MRWAYWIDKLILLLLLGAGAAAGFYAYTTWKAPLPEMSIKVVEGSWKENPEHSSMIKLYKEVLEEIRQPQPLLGTNKENFRNPFTPFVDIASDKFTLCDNCGGKNKLGATICVHCGAVIAPPPLDTDEDAIPDYWELKYQLNPKDAADAGTDPDKDGRSNLQEFRDGTDPQISDLENDQPPPAASELPFSLQKTYQKPVQIQFMGYLLNMSGEYTVQINWAGKTDFYKIGANVRGYVIRDFQKVEDKEFNNRTGVATFTDNSFIICQKKKFPPKKFLKQKLVTDNDVFAKIQFSETKKEQEIYIDSIIEDAVSGKLYKVKDIGLSSAKIVVEDQYKKTYILTAQAQPDLD